MICDEYLFEMRICTQLTKFIALPIFPSGVTHCESHSDPYGKFHNPQMHHLSTDVFS